MNTSHHSNRSLSKAWITHICRRVQFERLSDRLTRTEQIVSGHVALAEVADPGTSRAITLATGEIRHPRKGALMLVALGDAYSPRTRTGTLPDTLGECAMLTSTGLAGNETSRAARTGEPARLRLLGLPVTEEGDTVRLADFAEPPLAPTPGLQTLLLLGSARGVGTGGALLDLVEGLSSGGEGPVAVGLLGAWSVEGLHARLTDAGATHVLDGADIGHAGTHGFDSAQMLLAMDHLRGIAQRRGAHRCVVALGGGCSQPEIRALLENNSLAARLDGAILAASDALSARAAAQQLDQLGVPLLAVTGAIAGSPLATREIQPLACPVIASSWLTEPHTLATLFAAKNPAI